MDGYGLFETLNLPSVVSTALIVTLILGLTEFVDSTTKRQCTQTVKEEREKYMIQKISVKKKTRARCSESEEYFASLTGKDCKDKYQIVYMTERRKVKYTTYRIEKVCCPGENGSWCLKSAIAAHNSNSSKPSSSLTIVTIVVPIVAVLLLMLVTGLLLLRWRINRKRTIEKKKTSKSSKNSKSKCGSKKGPIGDDLTAEDKLIPYGVEVVDNSPATLTSPTSYPYPSYPVLPQSETHPINVTDYKASGCRPFTDDMCQTLSHEYSLSNEQKLCDDSDKDEKCDIKNCGVIENIREEIDVNSHDRALLHDIIVQNEGLTTTTEATAPPVLSVVT